MPCNISSGLKIANKNENNVKYRNSFLRNFWGSTNFKCKNSATRLQQTSHEPYALENMYVYGTMGHTNDVHICILCTN